MAAESDPADLERLAYKLRCCMDHSEPCAPRELRVKIMVSIRRRTLHWIDEDEAEARDTQ
ncbi:hypothetical protein FYJ24_03440 [Actinomycetaceae bacterium WB03_NA08]|uniref:Uncharacterized protein n=1 Tax=Scrofimicrobium canadense TaxID=2652290 RepID=A0A6N7W6P8_9ACTO|nr:hypothetical protein [Scrofimicrobium canadense]MSS83828.1 hypothetical protein [Scrofimicrobium canadense]